MIMIHLYTILDAHLHQVTKKSIRIYTNGIVIKVVLFDYTPGFRQTIRPRVKS